MIFINIIIIIIQNEQDKIFEEAKIWNLNSDHQKRHFWMSRKSLFKVINENEIYLENSNSNLLTENKEVSEFDKGYMNMLKEGLDLY